MRAVRPLGPLAGLDEVAPAPGTFAAVMATGIVSIATLEHGLRLLSAVLAGLAVVGLLVLAGLVVARAARRQAPLAGSLRDPATLLPLFGAVAALAVLGARFVADRVVVVLLGTAAAVGWLALVVVAARALRGDTGTALGERARGAWLLPAVATAGLVVTAADLTTRGPTLVVTAEVGWVLSIAAYAGVMALIAARVRRAGLTGELLAGDSWVVMGAVAISTLAADRVLGAARRAGETGGVDGWLRPAAVTCWALATVLLAVLVVVFAVGHAGRFLHAGRSLHGTALPRANVFWWAAVFPLGMYSVATLATAQLFRLRVLATVSGVFCWVALLAWLGTVVGFLRVAGQHLRG